MVEAIKNRPILVINYARSGGTLLNRLLGSYPDTLVLSEVNKNGCAFDPKKVPMPTVKDQVKEFYGIEIESDKFVEGIRQVYKHCLSINRLLVVRDWSFSNFNKIDYFSSEPSFNLDTIDDLNEFHPKTFVLVRDAIDVWLSHKCPEPIAFFENYLKYIQCLRQKKIRVFRYEDLTNNPTSFLRELFSFLQLPYVDVTKNFYEFNTVNGDINDTHNSRGFDKTTIKAFPRKKIPLKEIKALNNNSFMKECNKLMGYPTRYHNNWLQHMKFKLFV